MNLYFNYQTKTKNTLKTISYGKNDIIIAYKHTTHRRVQ